MKVVLLAGGFGTRLGEESILRPKPMIEIGGRPILWHIMKIYGAFGFCDFVVLGGHRVEIIRDYFLNYRARNSNFTIDLAQDRVEWLQATTEDWRVTVLDTGANTLTAGRLKRARSFIGDEPFFMTYGDGVADVDLNKLLDFHQRSNKWCTVTAVVQPGRFGALHLSDDSAEVRGFREKSGSDSSLINGGFFVCRPEVFKVLHTEDEMWEGGPMMRLVEAHQLASYIHGGYWQHMDTLRDKEALEQQWVLGAPWKLWVE